MANFDCPYFILEEILPDPTERTKETIIVTTLCRFILCLVCCIEAFRTCVFTTCCLAIFFDRVTKVMKILFLDVRDSYKFCVYYKKTLVIFQKVKEVLHIIVYLLMTLSFWTLVISCWASVKCSVSVVGLPIYLTLLLTAIGQCVGHYLAIPFTCDVVELATHVVSFHKMVAKIKYAKRKIRIRKMYLQKCEAIMPVRIKYGPFGILAKDFYREYIMIICVRIFDAILVVNY